MLRLDELIRAIKMDQALGISPTEPRPGCRTPKEPGVYDPQERAAEKQAARDRDEEALRSGQKTVEELRAENGLIQQRFKIREKR